MQRQKVNATNAAAVIVTDATVASAMVIVQNVLSVQLISLMYLLRMMVLRLWRPHKLSLLTHVAMRLQLLQLLSPLLQLPRLWQLLLHLRQ
jgi:hypothetical protein